MIPSKIGKVCLTARNPELSWTDATQNEILQVEQEPMNASYFKRRRLELNYSVGQVAAFAGVTMEDVNRVEAGDHVPEAVMRPICGILQINYATFGAETEAPRHRQHVTVARSGKSSDEIGFVDKFDNIFGRNDDVELVVLPDVKPKYDYIDYRNFTTTSALALYALYGFLVGAAIVELIVRVGLIDSRLNLIALAIYAAAPAINVIKAAYNDLKFYWVEMRMLGRLKRSNVKERAYGLGHGQIQIVRMSGKKLVRENYVIDPKRPIKRSVDGDIANYQVPVEGGDALTMLSLPIDPRIDALLTVHAPFEPRDNVVHFANLQSA